MFRTRQHIMSALERVQDMVGPSSASLISVGKTAHDPAGDPFRPGYLTALDLRHELRGLLDGLDGRARRLLVMWFVHDRPVGEIASDLKISRVHCYRLRNKALDAMLKASQERREAVRGAS